MSAPNDPSGVPNKMKALRASLSRPWNVLFIIIAAIPNTVMLVGFVAVTAAFISGLDCGQDRGCQQGYMFVLALWIPLTLAALVLALLANIPLLIYNRRDPVAIGVTLGAASVVSFIALAGVIIWYLAR